ncbi:MAG: D-glycero-beta-D-manno-heptose 1,7-bisphosphate 7-phosphatase [Gammaproteobacteria bacterium]
MKCVILDRDGVINHDAADHIKSPDEWRPIPGSLEAIARLNEAGYCVAVATNQSGISRGLFDVETLGEIHGKMQSELARVGGRLSGIFYCPHVPEDHCDCRKPKAGLLRQIGETLQIELTDVPFVGDSVRDMQAAVAVGAWPVLVRTGHGETSLASRNLPARVAVYDNLAAVADELLQRP